MYCVHACRYIHITYKKLSLYVFQVFNLNFHEVFSVVSDVNSILSMVFNSVTDELITGGTGGVIKVSLDDINSYTLKNTINA